MTNGSDPHDHHPPSRAVSRSAWGIIAFGIVALAALTLPTVALLERTIDAQPSLADDQTRTTLIEALRLKADYTDAHYNLGYAMERQGRIPEAIEQYEQVLLFDYDHVRARERLDALRGPGR